MDCGCRPPKTRESRTSATVHTIIKKNKIILKRKTQCYGTYGIDKAAEGSEGAAEGYGRDNPQQGSIFPSEKAEKVMGILKENTKALRGELGNKVAKQLRIVPELTFFLDSSLDYVAHIEELLKK